MSNGIVAKRYAEALFQLAKEQHTLDQAVAELRVVKQVFNENKDLQAVLTNPKFSVDKKKGILENAFATLSQHVKNTLFILVDRHRETVVPEFVDKFVELANEERGIAEAKVYSVRPLSEDEKKGLSVVFAAKVGKQTLSIENIVDPSLIGGVKIRIGNRIYDGSVSGKLERLERELTSK